VYFMKFVGGIVSRRRTGMVCGVASGAFDRF
jgi:hypothetical protein